ncbi:short-chain fatty acid transporter [Pseudomonas typographi]|uniref:Short-chain fatty acid transporter n=1 Tax=Pseudomonas typographi TaxID=2715964 RepID=A0ABR7YYU5_9PSED|nr:TIGR00366 family protein [Pseudomonas typographi]MBD1550863.1 short-chain fatty acid transporter [Pseudomonas typographi]MBD1589150.1 short-chain fatty acid transporter [Pseudomonas typographi]MBD1598328.1 short-chain fatty acid transporter [Pseudomonas typographi]
MQDTLLHAANPPAQPGLFERIAVGVSNWSERWFPDSYIFAALAVIAVALGALACGAPLRAVAGAFGDGYWSLIPFTMQMAFVAISGYVVAVSPPASKLITRLAALPRTARGAVAFIALVSLTTALFNWAISLVFSGLLVRAIARREGLKMDYRAAGAAAYLGMGATWALGLSSAAAQLQANPASLPKSLLDITGVIPFSQTIFLWQSLAMAAVLTAASLLVAWASTPSPERARTAQAMGVDLAQADDDMAPAQRPGEWLEHSPLLTLLIVALGAVWLFGEFTSKDPIYAISALNTYNLLFLILGMLLSWRPKRFLRAVARSVPSVAGVLIQFPLYGAIAFILTKAAGPDGVTLSQHLAAAFVSVANHDTFAVVMGAYSAVLGFLVPSGGGKWIVEAPYVMQAANELKVHLGWAVQVYNAAEALPNLINPFWMLPLLGVLGVKARDVVGFTFTQLLVHTPLVLFMLWAFSMTLAYVPPVMP